MCQLVSAFKFGHFLVSVHLTYVYMSLGMSRYEVHVDKHEVTFSLAFGHTDCACKRESLN